MSTIKQINNLKIKQTEKDGLYRVYDPTGRVIYASKDLNDVVRRCTTCKKYLHAKNVQQGNTSTLQLGDEVWAKVKGRPVYTTAMADELEYACWDLIEEYAKALGIKLLNEDGDDAEIGFDLAKELSALVLAQFERAGVKIQYQ